MVKCVRVLPCYMGGGLGGAEPPQGHSPNDMVMGIPGSSGEVLGGPWKTSFLFAGGEFVNGLMKY